MGNGTSQKKDLTALTEESISFLLNNTHFTREEIIKWHNGFIHDCPKGELDKKKFIELYKEFYPQGKAEKFCKQVFNVFDMDQSGRIDFTEFLIAISASSQGDATKKLQLAFRMYDTNRNGSLDKKEIEQIYVAIYDLLGEEKENRKGENDPKFRVVELFKKLDKDSSGILSEEEFIQGCLNDSVLMSFLTSNKI